VLLFLAAGWARVRHFPGPDRRPGWCVRPQPRADLSHRVLRRPLRDDNEHVLLVVRYLLVGELAVQQFLGKEVPVPPGQMAAESVAVDEQIDQPDFGAAAQQRVAVAAPQRGAGHDGRFARRIALVHPGADRTEPGPAIGVGERLAAPHLLDVRGRVERVGVGERPVQLSSQQRPNGSLAAARGPSDDQDHAAGLYLRRGRSGI
jgi:hypothetical protein